MLGISLSDSQCSLLADLLDCFHNEWLPEYLGLPIGGSPCNNCFWDPVLDRCKKELASWKANYLSFGDRITLTKETLSSLPIYSLSLFKIPRGIAAEIERIKANSFRGAKKFLNHT